MFRCWPNSLALRTLCRLYSTTGTMSAAVAHRTWIRVNCTAFSNWHRTFFCLFVSYRRWRFYFHKGKKCCIQKPFSFMGNVKRPDLFGGFTLDISSWELQCLAYIILLWLIVIHSRFLLLIFRNWTFCSHLSAF